MLDEQLAWEPPELADEVVPTPPEFSLICPFPNACPGMLDATLETLRLLLPRPIPIVLLGPEAVELLEPLGPEVVAALELTAQPPELPVKLD